MTTPHDRREELLAAAVTGDLDAAEAAELEELAAADPSLRDELTSLQDVVGRVDTIGRWDDVPAPPGLADRVAGVVEPVRSAPRWRLAAAAVVLVGLGSASTVAVQEWQDRPPVGPPGTLGAVETIAVYAQESGPLGSARVDAALVAHTWGTEAVLDVEGAPAGEEFSVWFVDEDGDTVSAGAFLGSTVEIHCRLNAAVMREDVRELRITDADGDLLATADLPSAV